MVALPTNHAFARGDGWLPLPFAPYDAACGTTTVHVSAPVNREFYLETTLADGTVQWHVTGSLDLNYATDDGKSITVNSSGPGHLLTFPNADVQVLAKGRNSFTFTPEVSKSTVACWMAYSTGNNA